MKTFISSEELDAVRELIGPMRQLSYSYRYGPSNTIEITITHTNGDELGLAFAFELGRSFETVCDMQRNREFKALQEKGILTK